MPLNDTVYEQVLENFGFDAYGLSEEMPDPVAKSLRSILDHMHLVDERMNQMCKELRKLDSSFDKEEIRSIADSEVDCFKQGK